MSVKVGDRVTTSREGWDGSVFQVKEVGGWGGDHAWVVEEGSGRGFAVDNTARLSVVPKKATAYEVGKTYTLEGCYPEFCTEVDALTGQATVVWWSTYSKKFHTATRFPSEVNDYDEVSG